MLTMIPMRALALAVVVIAMAVTMADEASMAQTAKTFAMARFRHADTSLSEADIKAIKKIRFIADEDFAPFSYRNGKGQLTGFSVALVDAMCKDMRIACEFQIVPFDKAVKALAEGKADAILSGIRRTPQAYEKLAFTRPYLHAMARFAVQIANPIGTPDARLLAGKRVGVIAGSVHEAFLKAYFKRAVVRPFIKAQEARDALRTGIVDALFGDAVQLMFWIASEDARTCCRLAAGAFMSRQFFTNDLTIAIRHDDRKLKRALDYGLDRMQESGLTGRIFRRFFPQSPW